VIREAKGVALHDLSFWAFTLPLLDGLPRIIREYQRNIGWAIPMTLDAESGRVLHDQVLVSVELRGAGGDDSHLPEKAQRAGATIVEALADEAHAGLPRINVPVPGCGVVLGGSCDLLWMPRLVELKLTNKDPGLRDVRQLLVYVALLHLAGVESIELCSVMNPRLGVSVDLEVEPLLLMTGGLTLDEFSTRLGQFLVQSGQSN
jgi:hypothetical protein